MSVGDHEVDEFAGHDNHFTQRFPCRKALHVFVGQGQGLDGIPVGIRRFFTWAPLLIPFYIPRGGDWDYAWGGAERLAHGTFPVLPPVIDLLWVYGAVLLIGAALFMALITPAAKK